MPAWAEGKGWPFRESGQLAPLQSLTRQSPCLARQRPLSEGEGLSSQLNSQGWALTCANHKQMFRWLPRTWTGCGSPEPAEEYQLSRPHPKSTWASGASAGGGASLARWWPSPCGANAWPANPTLVSPFFERCLILQASALATPTIPRSLCTGSSPNYQCGFPKKAPAPPTSSVNSPCCPRPSPPCMCSVVSASS